MASPSLTSIIEEDVGEFIALASLAAARRLVLVAKTTRAPALRHIRTVLCRIEREDAKVSSLSDEEVDTLMREEECEMQQRRLAQSISRPAGR